MAVPIEQLAERVEMVANVLVDAMAGGDLGELGQVGGLAGQVGEGGMMRGGVGGGGEHAPTIRGDLTLHNRCRNGNPSDSRAVA